jgi:hypothetical protein
LLLCSSCCCLGLLLPLLQMLLVPQSMHAATLRNEFVTVFIVSSKYTPSL